MGDPADLVVRPGAAKLLLGDLFVRDGPDHVRPGHEHVARALDHDVEVGDRRGVDGSTGAWPEDGGDLRDHAGRECVAEEDVRVAAERQHAFLDTRAARIVQADNGCAHFDRQIHDLDDLGCVGFGERTAEYREVLREGIDGTSVDASGAGDHAVPGDDLVLHPEIAASMRDQLVDFLEADGIEEEVDALPSRQLAGGMLFLEPVLAAAQFSATFEILEVFDCVHHTLAA
jgi:hypothetical protein